MPKKGGRTPIPFDWPMIELSAEAGSTEKELADEYQCDPVTIRRAIKKKYKLDFVGFVAWKRSKGYKNLRLATYKKVKDGNVQVILHLRKFWFDECDYELERRIKEKHEQKDDEKKKAAMFEIMENSREFVKMNGPVAEPKLIEDKSTQSS